MDADRFDRLSVAFAGAGSRRTLLAGAGVALLAMAGIGADVEAKTRHQRCLRNGAPCRHNQAGRCCSGICEEQGERHVCAPAPGSFGCTNEASDDACADNAKPCPHHGGACIVDENKRPLCVANTACHVCATDADCASVFTVGGRCIKDCGRCNGTTGGTVCVLPVS